MHLTLQTESEEANGLLLLRSFSSKLHENDNFSVNLPCGCQFGCNHSFLIIYNEFTIKKSPFKNLFFIRLNKNFTGSVFHHFWYIFGLIKSSINFVSIWMQIPANALEYDLQTAAPGFIFFSVNFEISRTKISWNRSPRLL